MKLILQTLILTACAVITYSCDETKPEKEVQVDVDKNTPEFKAYEVVQNLTSVRQLEAAAKKKNQTISLKINSTYVNGKDGFFWFQVVLNMGKAQLPKMNIKVKETTYDVTIRDDKTGQNITEEEYLALYPIKL